MIERPLPTPGEVYDYHYLWKWQDTRGETEGRKKRPICMTVVVKNTDGQHVLFIAPITTKEPQTHRKAVIVPQMEAKRAGLSIAQTSWIMVDELNVDVFEASYVFEDRTKRGSFSWPFTTKIIQAVQAERKRATLKLSKRR